MSELSKEIADFYQKLATHYKAAGRHSMLWRYADEDGGYDPYKIMVSEVMLQQTQVDRVAPKYSAFLWRFPTVNALATAPLNEVLTLWSGLGYNRRAKYLWQAAMTVQMQYGGQFPRTLDELQKLPGVGANTAGAIMAYAFNQPVIFLETNIRTVIIYHFFKGRESVSDRDIVEVMQLVFAHDAAGEAHDVNAMTNPRVFYWAMMDYGAHLKKTVGNLSRASKSYTKQSPFKGSLRQIRGEVIRQLAVSHHTIDSLRVLVQDDRLDDAVAGLIRDQLVSNDDGLLRLA